MEVVEDRGETREGSSCDFVAVVALAGLFVFFVGWELDRLSVEKIGEGEGQFCGGRRPRGFRFFCLFFFKGKRRLQMGFLGLVFFFCFPPKFPPPMPANFSLCQK